MVAASPARAADQDTQFWLTASAGVPLSGDSSVTLEASPRLRSDAAGGEQYLLRSTFDTRLADWLGVGGGVAYIASRGGDETRLFQQFTLKRGALAFRTQIEERFFQNAPRMQLRGRERVQLTLPLDPGDKVAGSAELYYIFQQANPAADPRIDQWRFKAEWRHRLSPKLEFSAGYLLALAPRKNAPDRISHIPQLAFAYSF